MLLLCTCCLVTSSPVLYYTTKKSFNNQDLNNDKWVGMGMDKYLFDHHLSHHNKCHDEMMTNYLVTNLQSHQCRVKHQSLHPPVCWCVVDSLQVK